MLCNYEFYKTEYFGNVIAEHDFPRLVDKAQTKLNMLTYGRIASGCIVETDLIKVKKCICAIADKMADFELSEQTIRQNGGGVVASVSSGSESISYKQDAKVMTQAEQNMECYKIAREYLFGTGLLYAGF